MTIFIHLNLYMYGNNLESTHLDALVISHKALKSFIDLGLKSA